MLLQNREGQRVPNVTFPSARGNTWKKLTSDDIFKNKTVVVFSSGAFTPTCSSTHLPRATTNWRPLSSRKAWTASSAVNRWA